MNKINEWQDSKRKRVEAEKWARLLEKQDFISGRSMKMSHEHFDIKLVIAGQLYQSGNNYHNSTKPYNKALAEVIAYNFKTLNEQVMDILKADEKAKQTLCKDELESILEEINE